MMKKRTTATEETPAGPNHSQQRRMRLGMIGLGRMGSGMSARLIAAGHEVIGFDSDLSAVQRLVDRGGLAATSPQEVIGGLDPWRVVWLMLPSGEAVDEVLEQIEDLLSPGDVIVDGGNSHYKDSQRRAGDLARQGIHYLDVGVSGGVWGEDDGFCLMIGGSAEAVLRLNPVFWALAPSADFGWGHVGRSGAGHFVKMVHNGIEYGLMQAYAEGFSLLEKKDDLEIDLGQVCDLWRHGSIIRSWLLDLTAKALMEDSALEQIEGWVADSGYGRWTVNESVELGCPTPVIAQALYERFASRGQGSFANRLLAALRHEFGGHSVRRRDDPASAGTDQGGSDAEPSNRSRQGGVD